MKGYNSVKKRIKFLGISLTKAVQNYIKNYKTLLEEIKEDQNQWKDIPGSRKGRINIVVKMTIPYQRGRGKEGRR